MGHAREESLDPVDWEEARALGHRMVDDMVDHLRSLPERKVWTPVPSMVKGHFREPVPRAPQSLHSVYTRFKKDILPFPAGNLHPRFWGWVMGAGTLVGAFAEFLSATMNTNSWGGDQASNHVESQVLSWMKTIVGFPEESSGLLVSGGSMANLICLAVARKAGADFDVSAKGVMQSARPLKVYVSQEGHNSIVRSIDMLGLGRSNLVLVPTAKGRRISLTELSRLVEADRQNGAHPLCVIGNAGTAGTGAIDDLDALADFCEREDLWFHVDGAIGAVAKCSSRLAPLFKGLERADSLAFDFHKWMSIPYEAGCVLIQDRKTHRETFASAASYLTTFEGGINTSRENLYNDLGPELSRGNKALKVWMSIKNHGFDKYASIMEKNVEQADYFSKLVSNHSKFRLESNDGLMIVCFRYDFGTNDIEEENELQRKLILRLQEDGTGVVSYNVIEKRLVLRLCIVNHRTQRSDVDLFFKRLSELGDEVAAGR